MAEQVEAGAGNELAMVRTRERMHLEVAQSGGVPLLAVRPRRGVSS